MNWSLILSLSICVGIALAPIFAIFALPVILGLVIWDIIKWHERRAISKAADELIAYRKKHNIPSPSLEEILKKD